MLMAVNTARKGRELFNIFNNKYPDSRIKTYSSPLQVHDNKIQKSKVTKPFFSKTASTTDIL